MKIKGHISFSKHNLLYDDMETCAGGDDCEIEIDDEELDRVVKDRVIKIIKNELAIVEKETKRFVVDGIFNKKGTCNHIYGVDEGQADCLSRDKTYISKCFESKFTFCPKCGERLSDE